MTPPAPQRPPLAYDRIMAQSPELSEHSWSLRDTVLYNLGIGFGGAAIEEPGLLDYVVEERLKAFPTMYAILGVSSGMFDPAFNIDYAGMLHGEQSLEVMQPLPPAGRARIASKVEGIWDKGPERGAVMSVATTAQNPESGETLALCRSTIMLRNNGGFGGSAEGSPRPYILPDREPDGWRDMPTRPEQALLYRLSGDTNPLHSDPQVAAMAGFPRPILMGLCSFAIAGRAMLAELADNDADRLRKLRVRFSGPVFPGETIRVEYWRLGGKEAAFRARVVERDGLVLTGGHIVLS